MNSTPTARLALGAVALVIVGASLSACVTAAPGPEASPSPTSSTGEAITAATDEVAKTLTYLIEEEKLAYDVYTVLGDNWNLRSMQNITRSESSHQIQVASLLAKYGVADPRSTEVGVFTDPDLQKLYDELIAEGSASASAAVKVGITIEKTDIADIDQMLALNLPTDVINVLETLRSGSQNHLAAFERQQ